MKKKKVECSLPYFFKFFRILSFFKNVFCLFFVYFFLFILIFDSSEDKLRLETFKYFVNFLLFILFFLNFHFHTAFCVVLFENIPFYPHGVIYFE